MKRPEDILYRWNVNEIARICHVDITTARRWKRGAKCPPFTALALLARDLGYIHPDWSGWVINDRGELCSPENWISTPGAVRSLELMQRTLGEYRRENRSLKAALMEQVFEEQPRPEEWVYEPLQEAIK
jgi:hypothetical protein